MPGVHRHTAWRLIGLRLSSYWVIVKLIPENPMSKMADRMETAGTAMAAASRVTTRRGQVEAEVVTAAGGYRD